MYPVVFRILALSFTSDLRYYFLYSSLKMLFLFKFVSLAFEFVDFILSFYFILLNTC